MIIFNGDEYSLLSLEMRLVVALLQKW